MGGAPGVLGAGRPARGGAPGALRAAPLALAALALAAPAAGRPPLTPQEQAGRRIYHTGESPSGAGISATVGDAVLPGTALPCASCHGTDGLGRAEGGARPSVLRWSHLTKPYGHVHEDGRRHPPFTPETLARAVRSGIDPAGNVLDPAMPRYSIGSEDLASLTAYLRRLEHDPEPGVEPRSVRIGTVVPAGGRLGLAGAAVRGLLEAAFAELNAAGGIHGRRLELAVATYDPDREDGRAAVERLLAGGEVFALVATLTPGAEAAVAEAAGRARAPLVGPITPFTEEDHPSADVFYASAGVREQARVLARWAVDQGGVEAARVAIVHAGADGPLAEAARAARAELGGRAAGGPAVLPRTGPAGDARLVERLRAGGTRAVLFLGGDADLAAFARAAEGAGFAPHLLVPGSLAARAAATLPRAFGGKVHLAYPSIPSDETEAGAGRLAALRARAAAGDAHRGAQVSAYVAASVLAEGLRRAGRELTREALVARLEGLYRHESGVAPPVTFRPGQRVGALGAYVVAADPAAGGFRPVTGWIALDARP